MANFNPNEVLVPLLNQYSSNAVPTTFAIAQSGSKVSLTGSVAATTLTTVTIPPLLGPNDGLRIYALFSCTSSANSKTVSIQAGGTTIQTVNVLSAGQTAVEIPVYWRNQNSQTQQASFLNYYGQEPSPGNLVSTSVNTAANFAITFTAQLASAGDTVSLEAYTIEVMRGDFGQTATTFQGATLMLDFLAGTDWTTSSTLDLNFVNNSYDVVTIPTGAQGSYYVYNNGYQNKAFSDLITFTRASSGTYFDATGTLQTATTNTPRFDYNPSTLALQGLLVEETRTNSIRNNTMVGAVAGTPGTLPTNWTITISGVTGLTSSVVGTGTENGVTYIDIRINGTATGAGVIQVKYEAINSVAAVTGQTWALTPYLKLAAGTTTGITTVKNGIDEYTSGGAYIKSTLGAAITLQSTALSINRFSDAIALSGGATTAYAQPFLYLTNSNGAAIDITLRIGLPQLELGAFATSVIPTSTVAVARAADVATVNTLTPWYNQNAGTFYAEFLYPITSPAGAYSGIFQADDTTAGNRLSAYVTLVSGNNRVGFDSYSGGVGSFASSPNTNFVGGTIAKAAAAFAVSSNAIVVNGGTPATSSPASIPLVTQVQLGKLAGSTNYLNGWLRRVFYYNSRLTNAQLQAITT